MYYDLIRNVEYAEEGLTKSGRSELGSLVRVLKWCAEQDIPLSHFDLPSHLASYREAASYLWHTIHSTPDEDAREALLTEPSAINGHISRKDTRELVRTRPYRRSAGKTA